MDRAGKQSVETILPQLGPPQPVLEPMTDFSVFIALSFCCGRWTSTFILELRFRRLQEACSFSLNWSSALMPSGLQCRLVSVGPTLTHVTRWVGRA